MVVGAFPIAKLGSLLLRQISKPIANAVKERAKASPFFRTYICMPPAQFYNWCEVKAKMWIMNLGKPVNIPSLNEAMAIELGANLVGEGIIFGVAAGVLYIEYNRQTRKETAKEQARKEELDTLHYTIQELYFTTERQDAQIRELTRMIVDLECEVSHKSWLGRIKHPKHAHHPAPDTEIHIVPDRHHHSNETNHASSGKMAEKDNESETSFVMRALEMLRADMEGRR
ncbi:putative OPA3-like protein CG13603 [Schistocerca americana]|uniref:putative OPA3-like protein CG13603 n=1 Tax=Schistocerca americana TaxID=7009 RepID=UPI001F4F4DD3|nr:putative OPA3-like protein CG13603 [Schistocerca americana]